MEITDTAQAEHYLSFIGYFRLVGYARHMRLHGTSDDERFIPGTTFENVLEIYSFDRKLRLLVFDAIERIEVSVRATLTNVMGISDGPFWLTNANNFDYGRHQKVTEEISAALGDDPKENSHKFIAHFSSKYSEPYPPSWMLMECMSLGAISRIYKVLRGNYRQQISKKFDLQHDILESWLHSIAFSRNICAHHSRMWRNHYTIRPKIPKNYRSVIPDEAANRTYAVCCLMHHFLKIISDGSGWAFRLRDTIGTAPSSVSDDMGFPKDWKESPFWGIETHQDGQNCIGVDLAIKTGDAD